MNRGARKREPRRHAQKNQVMSPEARSKYIRRIQKRKEDAERKQTRFEKRVLTPLQQQLYIAVRSNAPHSEIKAIRDKLKKSRRGNGHLKRKLRKLAHEELLKKSVLVQEQKATQKAERMEKYRQRHFKKRKTITQKEVPIEVRTRRHVHREKNAQGRIVRKVMHYALRNNADLISITVALTIDAQNGTIGNVRDYYEPEHKPESVIRRKVKRLLSAVERHEGNPTPGIVALVWDAYLNRPLSIAKYQRLAGARA